MIFISDCVIIFVLNLKKQNKTKITYNKDVKNARNKKKFK